MENFNDEKTKSALQELRDLCEPIIEYMKNLPPNFAVFIANGQANIFCCGDDSNSLFE